MAAVALNFQDGSIPDWVQMLPAGPDMVGRDGRTFRLTNPQSVVDAFAANGADLPIDYEHATQIKGEAGEKAAAVGWIRELAVRDGEIWARVEWTRAGGWSISDREYRYLSPAFQIDKTSGEIVKMVSAGLTNQPNLQLAALNRATDHKETTMDKAVLEALGLPANGTAADVIVAINKMQTRHTTELNSARQIDTARFVPKADHDMALNKIKDFEKADAARAEAEINAAIDAAITAGKIAPAAKDFHIAACKASGIKAFNAMVKNSPEIAPSSGLDSKPFEKNTSSLTAEDIAVCNAMGMDQAEFVTAKAKEGA